MAEDRDWRIRNQEKYLKGATFVFRRYADVAPDPNHDHCSFCWAKFMAHPYPEALTEGYVTTDLQHWVCPSCFNDFREAFDFNVVEDD